MYILIIYYYVFIIYYLFKKKKVKSWCKFMEGEEKKT